MRPSIALGLIALASVLGLQQLVGAQQGVSVTSAAELRAALLAGASTLALDSPISFTEDAWPTPLVIDRPVFIYSAYRVFMDLRGSSRPLLTVTSSGSLTLQRIFLRNFLPPTPTDLTGLGPLPPFVSSGGLITYRVVVYHFLPDMAWVFEAQRANSSWWAQNAPAVMSDVYTGAMGPDLTHPGLYSLRYQSPQYVISSCFAPVDLTSCLPRDAPADTALAYCLYTTADSLRNPHVRNVRYFHHVGYDRSVYNWRFPVIASQPKTYTACPGITPSVNMDDIVGGVRVQAPLEFVGIRFKGTTSFNYSAWPPNLPLLLSAWTVDGSGSVVLRNSTIEVPDLAGTVASMQALPGCCSSDPTRPNLQPASVDWPSDEVLSAARAVASSGVPSVAASGGLLVGAWPGTGNRAAPGNLSLGLPIGNATLPGPTYSFNIGQWVLSQNTYLQFRAGSLYDSLSQGTSASWAFDNVNVEQSNVANDRALCFAAALAQGATLRSNIVRVSNDVELRAALAASVRYIQVMGDIKLNPANWPTGRDALQTSVGLIEVRACHPVPGQRYTLDLSDLLDVVRAAGRLLIQGDLVVTGLGWKAFSTSAAASGSTDMGPVGAFTAVTTTSGGSGSVEFKSVILDDKLATNQAQVGAAVERVLRLAQDASNEQAQVRNTTSHLGMGATLGAWQVYLNTSSTIMGWWVFTNVEVVWQAVPTAPPPTAASSSSSLSTGAIVGIAIGSAVGAVVIIAAALLGYNTFHQRKRGGSSDDGTYGQTSALKDKAADLEAGDSGTENGALNVALNTAESMNCQADMGPGSKADLSAAPTGTGTVPCFEKLSAGHMSDISAAIAQARSTKAILGIEDLVLQAMLAEGSYGRVYKALWRGTEVAVKVITLPAHMSGRERHERMAVMEAAISSSLSHPNIVQTFTFTIDRVEGAKARKANQLASLQESGGDSLPCASTDHCVALNGVGNGNGGGVTTATSGIPGSNVTSNIDDVLGYEIKLVQEFCDLGSLRDKLDTRVFFKPASVVGANAVLQSRPGSTSHAQTAAAAAVDPRRSADTAAGPDSAGVSAERGGGATKAPVVAGTPGSRIRSVVSGGDEPLLVDLSNVLDTAIDIARAMVHLHREGIVHADLKPRNVLLKGSTTDPRGFVAKVADFGLSLRLSAEETHISNAYHGTLAYMAPETLVNGHVSPASDVYSFGIMLYELFTGETAMRDVNKAFLAHSVAKENLRPTFPPDLAAPFEYQLLACRCWESNPEHRPTFAFILEELSRMRQRVGTPAFPQAAGAGSLAAVAAGRRATGTGAAQAPGTGWGLPGVQPHVQLDVTADRSLCNSDATLQPASVYGGLGTPGAGGPLPYVVGSVGAGPTSDDAGGSTVDGRSSTEPMMAVVPSGISRQALGHNSLMALLTDTSLCRSRGAGGPLAS
ncbi:hypothetical protein HYH03_007246 [Edaphochlamys debaryana]|uniref:Protein kinase domain-containing protein n=1 Tax=Edaphochlamys debaryana TaxID=47281 RepID=A0A835Y2I8_9CHLO|nr:hypothetical protein HYH03_007246 [Edaphochlamys debaryana]|eukprot:KAG2494733.1 hypothetical protein HYH03_007246 [Edaphochlamys debaryana]